MHSSTHRLLCRIGFVLFCLLPTGMVAIWICWPESSSIWQQQLTNLLGLRARVHGVSHPRPGTIVLEDVHLSDPELGDLARLPSVRIVQNAETCNLLIPEVEIAAGHLDRVRELLHDRILRGGLVGDRTFTARISELTLADTPLGQASHAMAKRKLTDVVCTFEPTEIGSRFTAQFRYDGNQLGDVCEFSLERRLAAGGAQPTTRWFLDTGDSYLPCRLIARQISGLAALGESCEFRGVLWIELTPRGWEGDFSGRFRNVDLKCLVSNQFPHTLPGLADVELRRAKLREGRLIDAAGSLSCREGSIGEELLDAAAAHLKLKRAGDETLSPVGYQRLDLGFQIDQSQLTIRGQCDARGTILLDEQGRALLAESADATVPAVSLARMLVPQTEVQIPLTQESAALLRVLPAPQAITSP